MLVWDEVKNTVTLVNASVGRLVESARETTTAGYTPPSAGSLGGIIVRTTLAAVLGTPEAATEVGINWTVNSSRAATIASCVVLFNLCYPQIGQD